jgi:hypothetical protein
VIKILKDSKYTHFVLKYIKVHAASARRHCENPGAKCSPAAKALYGVAVAQYLKKYL